VIAFNLRNTMRAAERSVRCGSSYPFASREGDCIMADTLTPLTAGKLDELFNWFKGKSCVVAFSGGVDSATLANALVLANDQGLLKIPPVGYFAGSFTSTELERSEARRVAAEIGLPLVEIESKEFDNPNFVANTQDRCYWCKKIRFSELRDIAQRDYGDPNGEKIMLVDGANATDSEDFRPGQRAAKEVGVRSPLAEVGLTKPEIRELAGFWNLSIAKKPSTPCLATRLAYNIPLSNELLRQVEAAEIAIMSFGVSTCRARIDAPKAVRIELPEEEIDAFLSPETRKKLVAKLRAIGFNFISLDLEGFFSGKNNRSISA